MTNPKVELAYVSDLILEYNISQYFRETISGSFRIEFRPPFNSGLKGFKANEIFDDFLIGKMVDIHIQSINKTLRNITLTSLRIEYDAASYDFIMMPEQGINLEVVR